MNRVKPRFLMVYPLLLLVFLTARTTETRLSVGVGLALLGLLIRLWANGYVGHVKVNWTEPQRGEAKIGRLITAGPYAHVRHPLYLGTLLIGLSLWVIVGRFWLGVVGITLFLIIYRRKMDEEDVTLQREGGEAFGQYQRTVPRWLPTGRRATQPSGQWSWQGIVASKEPKTVAWVLVLLILLYFRKELLQERRLMWGEHALTHAVLLGLMTCLILADGAYELVRRLRRRRA
ncbi:MAG: isoprenylcysteine carboxylmethyltransferase family protein [Candidatus Omnitrophica bacterium]|nr:isoprenylcysteine carboxylmethyltransferase family protein [Candidatus Omnitrophota bacterium]